ncbi:MAG: radical SAM family heme chaperone HemW [Clostridium sp.]
MNNQITELPVGGSSVLLELYIHIPFCMKKCLYCDFLSFAADDKIKERYVEALIKEIRTMGKFYEEDDLKCGITYEVCSVFFGGGTPSVLKAEQTIAIMKAVKESFRIAESCEITTEANPGTLSAEQLTAYLSCGINRLSLGLQSADDQELKELGRIHTFHTFLESFHLAREAGFENINVDLMSALPGQTIESYVRTLHMVADLSPEHISAYSLIIEEGTPFYERYGTGAQGNRLLPDEDTDRAMYHVTKTYLKTMGYERYEISNYAKPGKECIHNTGYWMGTEYLGLGLGSSSYMNGERFTNTSDISSYMKMSSADFMKRHHHEERECLTAKAKMEEFMFLGLRLSKGIRTEEFQKRFGISIEQVYGTVIQHFLKDGLMEDRNGSLRLTEYGTDVSNAVLSEFLL